MKAARRSEPAAAAADRGVLQTTRRLMWALVVPMLLLLAVLTFLQYRQLQLDAERDLLRRAGERAQELEAAARPVMAHVADLRLRLEAHWHAPPDAGPELGRALGVRRHEGRHDGWTLDAAPPEQRERLGQFWWAPADGRLPEGPWLHRASDFVAQARIAHQRMPAVQATWFAAADENTSFGYPWVGTAAMLVAMGQPTLQAIDGPRRAAAERSRRDLARDPEDISFWGPPYVSQLDGQAVISHGAAVVVDGQYRGEVSVDLRLAGLQGLVERWQAGRTRSWIIDAKQLVLADSAMPLLAPAAPGLADTRVVVPLAERLPEGLDSRAVDGSMLVPDQVHRSGDWVLVAAVRIGSPWTYVQAVPAAALTAQVLPTLLPNLLLALALGAMLVVGQWLLERWFVRPASAVLEYLERLAASATATPPALSRRWQGWIAVVSDTFRRRREAELRERRSEAYKSAMFDGAPVAVVVVDHQGRFVEFNAAAERLFGVPRAAAIGRAPGELVVPMRRRAVHDAAIERIRSGDLSEGFDKPLQMTGVRADGSEFPMEIRTFRFQLDEGWCYTAFVTDLTEQRRAAEQIARQREALRQSEKLTAMGSLLASVAHELNNPLTIVVGRAGLIEEKAAGTPLAADATRIREAAERCGRIVRTFLNMARQRPDAKARVQLNDLVRAAAELLAYTLKSHAVELKLELADGLPEVMADADQIGQVVLNLLVNAQQALAGRPAPRRIEVRSGVEKVAEGSVVWLDVADNGPGVPEALREQIFDPFFTTKSEGSGTGLGLPVSRSIAREHGGDLVLAAPDAGGGARFRLTLAMPEAPAGND